MGPDLVIGYGNTLRGDDGLGQEAAAAVTAWDLPGLSAIACHQLGPELAPAVSAARRVVFVDAAAGGGGPVRVTALEPEGAGEVVTHAGDPRSILCLAKALFGRCPPAWWVTVPVENFEYRQGLSGPAREGLSEALARVREILS